MDWIGFVKNYNVKIPFVEYADYYIETLYKSKEYSDILEKVEDWKEFENGLVENKLKDTKYKYLEESRVHFKDLISKVVEQKANTLNNQQFQKVNFLPEENKKYVSIDVRQGNWTVSRKGIQEFGGLPMKEFLPDWSEYVSSVLNFPKCLAESKGFRQAILGSSVNPKKFSTIQKHYTNQNIEILKGSGYDQYIVGVNDEEIQLEVPNQEMYDDLLKMEWLLPVKISYFRVNFVTNRGDYVRLDTYLNDD